jgi:hypothetical protein
MTRERIILDNRSSMPLYEVYEMACNFYFQEWSEECISQAMVHGDFLFLMTTNKKSITIKIYDL